MGKWYKLVMVGLVTLKMSCQQVDPSFVVGSEEVSYLVSPQFIEVPQKLDLLLVVDNSGSMATSQQHLAQNFPRFIRNFIQKKYDFRIAVITTDAYRARFYSSAAEQARAHFRRPSTGELFLTRDTENLEQKFVQMVQVGTNGHGDERAFMSFETALTHPANQGFRRSDAFLAIIIISDEDDFSHSGLHASESYSNPSLYPISYFVNFLDNFAGVGKYSVYSVSILDEQCRKSLANQFTERKIGRRYHELVLATHGINTSLCSPFGDAVSLISDTIVDRTPPTSTFYLNYEPVVETIVVTINGQHIAEDAVNGWTFDPNQMTISIHGSASSLVQNGGVVKINFTPKNPFHR
ncbi:MAG: VWA domain-containing protein [Bdellovibrionaceae bacterium]|nr:VWA domain-containing protein [Pseudobdellovibrionaceae bacterium]MDW8189795.1 VWA domain-containing protein [Pseudobdellovibrionaceae bacterium]